MKHFALFVLMSAALAVPALAQPAPPGPDGPPPATRQRIDEARAGARSAAMNALSSDHQRSVNALLDRVKSGHISDIHDATKKIDAVLSPKESQDVLAVRDKMMSDIRASMADQPGTGGSASDQGGPPPGPDGDGPPRYARQRDGRRAMHNDPGFALLMLSLDRDQMRSLFMGSSDRR